MTSLFYVHGYYLDKFEPGFVNILYRLSRGAVFIDTDEDGVIIHDYAEVEPVMKFDIPGSGYYLVSINGYWFVAFSCTKILDSTRDFEAVGHRIEEDWVKDFDKFLEKNVSPGARAQRYIVRM